MSEWIVRALAAGVLLSLAALAGDRAAGWLGRPRRWVWTAAMAASLLLPLLAHWLPDTLPALRLPIEAPAALPQLSGAGVSGADAILSRSPAPLWSARTLALAWLASSLAMLAAIGWTCMRLRALRRRCSPADVDGCPVLLSGRYGPAVLGLRRPAVVLPAWVLAAPSEERALILRHEREHVAAGDVWLLFLGTLAVAAMPWNPALWWQHRRLRLGTEIDCDTRVLAHGASRRAYGAVLLRTAGDAPLSILAPAWGEAKSHLERRIVSMTTRQTDHRMLASVLLGGAALCIGVAACDVAADGAVGPTAASRGVWDGAKPEVVVSAPQKDGPSRAVGLGYIYRDVNMVMGNGRPFPTRMPHRAIVDQVVEGSPAQVAGVQAGDTLISVNGRDGSEVKLFPNRVPGTRYALRVGRSSGRYDLALTVGPPSATR